jgi:nucleoid DNA-binding protein
MPRVSVDWRSASKENYKDFCKKHKTISLSYDEWSKIIYTFNESFKEYILETGEKVKFPFGFGEFAINKKKRKQTRKSGFFNLYSSKKTRKNKKDIY